MNKQDSHKITLTKEKIIKTKNSKLSNIPNKCLTNKINLNTPKTNPIIKLVKYIVIRFYNLN